MTDFEQRVLADLSTLKAEMKSLVGNGQPGRLKQIEQRVEKHEAVVQRAVGIAGLAGTALTLVHLGIDYLRIRH